jgi:hypothetical protein
MRQESSSKSVSNGSQGGANTGALARLESFSKSGSSGSGVRSKNVVGNMSNRYEDYDEQDKNLLSRDEVWSSTPSYWWNVDESPTSVSPERDSA